MGRHQVVKDSLDADVRRIARELRKRWQKGLRLALCQSRGGEYSIVSAAIPGDPNVLGWLDGQSTNSDIRALMTGRPARRRA